MRPLCINELQCDQQYYGIDNDIFAELTQNTIKKSLYFSKPSVLFQLAMRFQSIAEIAYKVCNTNIIKYTINTSLEANLEV